MIVPVLVKFYEISRPERKFSSVVLPAPEAPIIAKNWPGMTVPLTPLIISFDSLGAFFPLHLPLGGSAVMRMSDQVIYIGFFVLLDIPVPEAPTFEVGGASTISCDVILSSLH